MHLRRAPHGSACSASRTAEKSLQLTSKTCLINASEEPGEAWIACALLGSKVFPQRFLIQRMGDSKPACPDGSVSVRTGLGEPS